MIEKKNDKIVTSENIYICSNSILTYYIDFLRVVSSTCWCTSKAKEGTLYSNWSNLPLPEQFP